MSAGAVPSVRTEEPEAQPQSEAEAPEKPTPSGRLLLRMPRTLHAELTRAAEREGTSLNQFITSALASTIGWRDENGRTPAVGKARTEARQAAPPSRAVVLLLLANAVAIGLAAIAAIVVLLVAWQA